MTQAGRFTLMALLALGTTLPLQGAVFTVTKTADTLDGACDHDCSLREAFVAANHRPGPDAILLGSGVYTLTREGRGDDLSVSGDLDSTDNLAILGAGAKSSVIDGGGIDRVLHGLLNLPLEVHGVTIRNGRALGTSPHRFAGDGGGILGGPVILESCHVTGNLATGWGGGYFGSELHATNTTFSENQAKQGGGIGGFGILRLTNVTISGNHATEVGGGLDLVAFDQFLQQVTITNNSAPAYGGLFVIFETCPSAVDPTCRTDFGMVHSILAGNSAPSHPDCPGYFFVTPDSYNLFGINDKDCNPGVTDRFGTPAAPLDPRLTPLGDHGGSTPTHLPLPDSPALDLAPAEACLFGKDQRGRPRPANGNLDGFTGCDAGAVERIPACQPGVETLCLGAGDRFQVTVHWTAQGQSGAGKSVPLTADTGAFWFFDPANVELNVKALDGCGVNGRFWVFLTGLTDVEVDVEVRDTLADEVWTFHHAAGSALQPRLDTDAFDTCSGPGDPL